MDADFIRMMYEFHYWARDRVLKAADGLSEEDYGKANGFTYGSIRGILTHMAGAEAGAIRRWTGDTNPAGINQEAFPTIEGLKARWMEEEKSVRSFLGSLKDADLQREIVTTGRDGAEFRRPLYL